MIWLLGEIIDFEGKYLRIEDFKNSKNCTDCFFYKFESNHNICLKPDDLECTTGYNSIFFKELSEIEALILKNKE